MRPESCTIDELITLFKGAGIRNVSLELIERHIEEGAPVHDDGTLDLFDYAAWLVGTPSDDTRIRVPPTEIFDIEEVNPTRLAGWLSMYNHMNYDVSRNKIGAMFQEFNSRLKSRKNEKSIDFVKFVAFCATRRKSGGFKPKTLTAAGYDAHRAEMARRSAAQSAEGRDIGEIPKPAHPNQIEACRENFKLFCETYFPEQFSLEWSDDHLRCIEKIEQSVLRGGLFALALPRGSGKALALDTPLPTPTGWITMGDVKVGDELYDEQGKPCRVVLKSEIFTGHKCYKVTFNDGSSIVCDADHLWSVEDIWKRKNPIVVTTEWLSTRYAVGHRGYHESRFRVPFTKPIEGEHTELPIAPYALGLWLGDGSCASATLTLYNKDAEELCEYASQEEGNDFLYFVADFPDKNSKCYRLTRGRGTDMRKVDTGNAKLRALNLLNNEHIPAMYLRASVEERQRLIQGIMDTDGCTDKLGHCEICIKYKQFANDFEELLASLGIKFSIATKYVELDGKTYGPYSRFYINAYKEHNLFKLKRKQQYMRPMPQKKISKETGCLTHTPCEIRTITEIVEVPSVQTQCVMVDSPNHLYLCGRRMIPTHNTSMCEAACIWAVLYGHRKFICLIGATETAADEMLASIKVELETNELLQEDFPSACYPVACLEGIAARCNGQTCNGERTRIKWTNNELVLPTIKGSVSSGIIIRVTGILGRIRGMKFKRPDGKSVRPDLVIIDDPQTRESASSIEQNRKRLQTLNGDILGLAGPSKKISGIMPCTVIRSGDMADTILDATKNPEWNGEKAKMLYVMPRNMKLWEEYNAIREESLRNDGNFERATQFYIENREAMDEGAVVGWKERFNHDEVSALQNAMNLLFRDEVSFAAEYQNEPLSENIGDETVLSADFIAGKLNGIRYLTIPLDATCLTMFVDVQKTSLWYTIMAFSDTFSGYVIDYGTYPEQQSRRYTLASLRTKLSDVFPNAGLEGQLYSALNHLLDEQLEKVYLREDGTPMKLNFSMIDANWGESTNIVYQVCRLDKWQGRVMPSHGHFVGASSKPMSEYRKKAGEKLGLEWYIPNANGRAIRHVVWNTNYWKSFVMARLAVAMGDNGCFSLYGNSPMTHEMYSEHMTAEYSVRVQGRGRIVDEWRIRPEHNDNHFFDCTVGCAVCASIIGCALPEQNKLVEAAKQQKFSFTTDANGRIERKVQEVPLPVETAHEPPLAQKPQAISLKQLYAKKRGQLYKPH